MNCFAKYVPSINDVFIISHDFEYVVSENEHVPVVSPPNDVLHISSNGSNTNKKHVSI